MLNPQETIFKICYLYSNVRVTAPVTHPHIPGYLGSYLETAYHTNVFRHSLESCVSLVWIDAQKLSLFTKQVGKGSNLCSCAKSFAHPKKTSQSKLHHFLFWWEFFYNRDKKTNSQKNRPLGFTYCCAHPRRAEGQLGEPLVEVNVASLLTRL